jgi:hypothetical protein
MIETCKNCDNFKLNEYLLKSMDEKNHYEHIIKRIICIYNNNQLYGRKTIFIEDCINIDKVLKGLKLKIKQIDYHCGLGVGEYKIYRSLYQNILYRIKRTLKLRIGYINIDNNKYLKDN